MSREPDPLIDISIAAQHLWLRRDGRVLMDFAVSTARNGPGERVDSECTPRGAHVVCEKIGADCAPGTVFVARSPTGEIYSSALRSRYPQRDWILTRILWLGGTEPGRNAGGEVDSRSRFIYIHGAPDEATMGAPGSRGCVRMHNADIIELFDAVEVGTRVLIRED